MQPWKARKPMLVTLFGISIDVRFVQPENAAFPMLVTPSGISIDVRPVQPWKASSPIFVTKLPNSTVSNAFLQY